MKYIHHRGGNDGQLRTFKLCETLCSSVVDRTNMNRMTRPLTFLLLWSLALFCGACSAEDSSVPGGDPVPLQPGIHAGATLASSRTLVNGIGTGADQIGSIGIYLVASDDGTLYPGSNAAGTTFTKGSGNSWSSTPPTYVGLRTARLYAWSPATTALTGTGSGTTLPTLPVSVPAAQTFDGANSYSCSTFDYLYGSGISTQGSVGEITANSQSPNPAIHMQHALAQLLFRIQTASDRPVDTYDYVKKITLTAEGGVTPFKSITSGQMALASGALSGEVATAELTFTATANPQQVGETTTPATVAYGLVVPRTAAASATRVKLALVLGQSGTATNERTLTLSTDVFNPAWSRGNQYVYTLTLNKRGITIQSATVNPWTDETSATGDMEPQW